MEAWRGGRLNRGVMGTVRERTELGGRGITDRHTDGTNFLPLMREGTSNGRNVKGREGGGEGGTCPFHYITGQNGVHRLRYFRSLMRTPHSEAKHTS